MARKAQQVKPGLSKEPSATGFNYQPRRFTFNRDAVRRKN